MSATTYEYRVHGTLESDRPVHHSHYFACTMQARQEAKNVPCHQARDKATPPASAVLWKRERNLCHEEGPQACPLASPFRNFSQSLFYRA